MIDLGNFFCNESVQMTMLCGLHDDYRAITKVRAIGKTFCKLVDDNFPELLDWRMCSVAINEIKKQIAPMEAKGRYWKKMNPSLRHLFKESKKLIWLRQYKQRLETMCREFRSLFDSIEHGFFKAPNPIVELLGGYKSVMYLPESGEAPIVKHFDDNGHLSFRIIAGGNVVYELAISDWTRNVVALSPGTDSLVVRQYNNTRFSSPMRHLPKVQSVLEDKLRPLWSVTLLVDGIPRGKAAIAVGMQCGPQLQSLKDVVQGDDVDFIRKLSELVI